MAGITGLGTTYNLPNYTGQLFGLTSAETKFLSAIGGLTGGQQATNTEFEWETFDLRPAGQNTKTEGAAAPDAEERVRGNASNILQIHQEAIDISYTKLSATGRLSGLASQGSTNPVTNELAWQTEQMIKQVARDVNHSFIQGVYYKPDDNGTARRTRGLLDAITTNVVSLGVSLGTGLTATASTDKVTKTSHGLTDGTRVKITNISTANGLTEGGVYWVVASATNDFKLSVSSGGAAVDITADSTVDVTTLSNAMSETSILDAMQMGYDNGGFQEDETRTVLVGSRQRRAITAAFADAHQKAEPIRGTIAGVTVDRIETDFGPLNIMMDRQVPSDVAIFVSLEQCAPVFMEVPGMGHFFVEPLAKTGASEKAQLYGEIGLKYGTPQQHAVIKGLK